MKWQVVAKGKHLKSRLEMIKLWAFYAGLEGLSAIQPFHRIRVSKTIAWGKPLACDPWRLP